MTTKYNKESRVFLNARDKSCMAAVYWNVSVIVYDKKGEVDANFGVNKEGQHVYLSRRADLRPLQILQRELNKFNDAYDEAERVLEEFNAKSKNKD